MNKSPTNAENLITDNLDIWTSAIKKRGSQGRGSSKKITLYGIKKLRELILELAVRGLLVPQDSNDEPASVLLEKIAAEKAQLIKDKKIKKQKPLPPISNEEKPFELPKGWEWARLGDVTNYGVSDKAEPETVSFDTWVLELEDVEKETSKLLQKVRFSDRAFKSSKNKFNNGDVIYGKLRPYLDKVLVADEDGVCTTEMIPFRAFSCIDSYFLRLVMKTPYFKRYANNSTHGMNLPRMGTDKARLALIPILNKAAQSHIVAKVDELMTLCNQLEEQTEDSLASHQTLVENLLDALTQAPDNNGFTAAWERIAQHFDILFITEHSIDLLKQTILQLAVMGKLVPQDPNDEPASVLLEKIAAEKEQLIKDKKIKKQKPLPPIAEDEKPFELPKGWEWCRSEEIANFVDPQPSHRTPPIVDGGIPYIGYTDINHEKGINFESARKVGLNILEEHQNRYSLKAGDFVFGKIGTLGQPYFLEEPFNYCLSANLILIQPNLDVTVPKYLALYLNSPALYQVLGDQKTNSTHAVFGIKKARLLAIPYPPIAEQNKIVNQIEVLNVIFKNLKDRIRETQKTQLHLADSIIEQHI